MPIDCRPLDPELAEIAALEVERARVEARISELMVAFADRRQREAQRHTDARLRELEAGVAADELGLVVRQPTMVVQQRLAQTRRVRARVPSTWAAHLRGEVDGYRVSLIAGAVAKLRDPAAQVALDEQLSGTAGRKTVSQLRACLRRFVARWAVSNDAVRDERSKRAVWVSHQDHGMSYLTAYVPTRDALRIEVLLTDLARDLDDGHTMDQRRADLLVDRLLAGPDGQPAPSRTVLGITVPLTTLAGLDDQPGVSFDGGFALPAGMVRDLMREPGTLWLRILTDPAGRILDTTELRPFPSPSLRAAVQARDGTCRFPTCSRPASACDIDHKIPRPEGPTRADNLQPLCRRHHNQKTHLGLDPPEE